MTAAVKNFKLEQNATFNEAFQWVEEDEDGVQTPVSLVGWSAKAQVRQTPDDDVVLLELSSDDGTIILGDNGVIQFNAPYQVTIPLDWGRAYYDLRMEHINGVAVRLLEGYITASKDVTR